MKIKSSFSQRGTLTKFMLWFGFMIAGLIGILILLSVLLQLGILGRPSGMKTLLAGQNILIFILPALLAAYCWSDNTFEWMHMNKGIRIKTILLAIFVILCASPAINLLSHWNQQLTLPSCLSSIEQWMKQMEENNAHTTQLLLGTTSIGGLLSNLLVIGLFAAIGEECLFRGVLLGLTHTKNPMESNKTPHLAIWVIAILFSAIHLQFYGFIPRMLMGALLGYALVWTGSLWTPILMHFTNNAVAVIGYYTLNKMGKDDSFLEEFGYGNTLWVGILSLLLVAAGIYLLRRSTTISKASSRTSIGN